MELIWTDSLRNEVLADTESSKRGISYNPTSNKKKEG